MFSPVPRKFFTHKADLREGENFLGNVHENGQRALYFVDITLQELVEHGNTQRQGTFISSKNL